MNHATKYTTYPSSNTRVKWGPVAFLLLAFYEVPLQSLLTPNGHLESSPILTTFFRGHVNYLVFENLFSSSIENWVVPSTEIENRGAPPLWFEHRTIFVCLLPY